MKPYSARYLMNWIGSTVRFGDEDDYDAIVAAAKVLAARCNDTAEIRDNGVPILHVHPDGSVSVP